MAVDPCSVTQAPNLIAHSVDILFLGELHVNQIHAPTPNRTTRADATQRTTPRRRLPARLTWKDQRGTTRFASVVTRNVSEFGVYVECQSPVSIPLFRLVQFQLERDGPDFEVAGLAATGTRAQRRLPRLAAARRRSAGPRAPADGRSATRRGVATSRKRARDAH